MRITQCAAAAPVRFIAVLAAMGYIMFGMTGAQATDSDDQGLALLRGWLDGLTTISADFRQQVIDRDLEPVEQSSGRVVFMKPGRFRWDYTQPYERVISSDGERVWLYEADLEQVTIRRLSDGLGETPAALLTGQADILDQFEYRGSTVDGELRWLRLEPRSPESDFAAIELGFAGEKLRRLFLTDQLGQRTRIILSNIETGGSYSDAFFRFEPPAGVDVISEDEL